MARLLNNIEHQIMSGDLQLTYTIGTGTAKLRFSVDGKPFQDVPNSDQNITTSEVVSLSTCVVKSVLTGDAQLSINRVSPR